MLGRKLFILGIFLNLSSLAISADAIKPIHPLAFEGFECWISDTICPVYVTLNIDAIQNNRNQFDYTSVTIDGQIVMYQMEDGYRSYKILLNSDKELKIIYYNNGGGTLTTETKMEFQKSTRQIKVNEISNEIKVLELTSIK